MKTTNEEVLSRDVRKLPMMPIRDMVIFPHMMTPVCGGTRIQRESPLKRR